MFTQARLRLTALYTGLLGGTLTVVVAAIVLVVTRDFHHAEDLELRLRAETLAAGVGVPGGVPALDVASAYGAQARRHLEGQGLLTYVLPVPATAPQPALRSRFTVPNEQSARTAAVSRQPRYDTVGIDDGHARLYSLPVVRDGTLIAVVQIARSHYFVDRTVARLLVTALIAGGAGLLASAGAGFWLAGRTLRPIAVGVARQRAFAADASHELRTPLSTVLGNAELLERHPDRAIGEYQEVVHDIVTEARRLAALVTNLLTLARSDEGQLPQAITNVNLSTIGTTVARHLEPQAREKGLRLCMDVTAGVCVQGDAAQLHGLTVILLDNAIRYTPSGEVRVRVDHDGGGALLTVSDTGVGIADEHLPHLFERFYRIDSARAAGIGGTGLGLSIAESIVRAHGGRIEVSSQVGCGSRFTVHLPSRPPSSGPP